MVKNPLAIEDFPTGFEDRLEANIENCRKRIAAAAKRSGRKADDVTLLTVSKYIDSGVMRILYDLGIRKFGENRSQDAVITAKHHGNDERLTNVSGNVVREILS